MTTLAQAEVTDSQRAGHAKTRARKLLPPEMAEAVIERLHSGINFPNLCNRARWLNLIREVERLPEVET